MWPIDRALSGATIPGQSGPGSNVNEGVLHIPQISKAGASPSDCLELYPDTLWGSSPSAEIQSVYSTALPEWVETIAGFIRGLIPFPRVLVWKWMRVEFEPFYFEFAFKYFIHNATGSFPLV